VSTIGAVSKIGAIRERLVARLRLHTWHWSATVRQAIERSRYRPRTGISSADLEILLDLESAGIHVTSLSRLGLPGTDQLLEHAAVWRNRLVTEAGSGDGPSFAVLADPPELASRSPELLLWGLQDRLFDILESYTRLSLRCLNVAVRRDLADGTEHSTRRWHIDINDFRYLKIIVYLNDVGDDGGPFEYLPDCHSRSLLRSGQPKSVDPARLSEFGDQPWRTCSGPAGTTILVDTARLYHRGKSPQQERFTVFYSFASHHPRRPDLCSAAQFPLARLNLPLGKAQAERLDWPEGSGWWNIPGWCGVKKSDTRSRRNLQSWPQIRLRRGEPSPPG
jgi:hypothetical protein